ncbi:flagellar hook-length control protein FliK [Allochromatium vinosum]|uniref:Flagellar hook-length control protein n=1 Tax=Allochromatium vinosum (strain ATCC 17899 / DSM 180 / NBRC 103801 / NCIMB 10441 / D) TaxID=572477 RepID=D3RRC7_ALLVD|nr:flagellar hook-length control protein FliK [Allochromatium vinosum]ADC63839.1 flagellar hook-length control protein [Allochromatium vinosum DSM 180]
MMQTTTVPTGLSALLSQILGGLDESGVQLLGGADGTGTLGQADVGEFVQSLAGQLKLLMVERGADPVEVAAIADETLVAEFFALVQGQMESSSGGLSVTTGLGELMRGFEVSAVPGEEDRVSAETSPGDAPAQESEAPVWLAALPTVILERLTEAGRILPTPTLASASASALAAPSDSEPVDLETLTRALLRQVTPSANQDAGVPVEPANLPESSPTDLETLTRALLRQVTPSATQDAGVPAELANLPESSPTDLETLTRTLLRQVTPSANRDRDAEQPAVPDTLNPTESASILPAWLARQLNSDDVQTWLNTAVSVSLFSNAASDSASPSIGEKLRGLATNGEQTIKSTSDLETVLESTELNDVTPMGAPRTPTAMADTATTGTRLQTLDLNRLLQPGGEQRLAEQVRWSVDQGLDTAEIKLHPPSLGALDVRLVQEGDKTHVQFVSAHPIAREVLEAAVPRLREALAQDGVLLGNVSVSDQAPSDRGETGRERGQSAGTGDHEAEDDEDRIESIGTLSVLSRRLDVFT